MQQHDDPAELIYPGSDDAGWDPLAVREMDDAVRRGDLACRMLRVSARLAAAVANRDRDTIARVIGSLQPEPVTEDVAALLVAQAGVIAGLARHENRTVDEALDWIDFDEWGWSLPAPEPEPAEAVAPVIPITADQEAAQHRADLERELSERARGRRDAA